uniref:Long-chain-fatty-acid--CoA ligase n=1 Tax=Globodera pallida TaxID=36090 RepID=A0A183C7F3_GLOPA
MSWVWMSWGGTLLFYRVRWLLWRSFRSGEPLHGHLLRLVRRHPHKQCVVEVESGRSLTFAQFNAHANAYAHLFSKNLNIGVLCYIYTSGTTGAPKAAVIRHYRFYLMGMGCGMAFGIRASDRIYLTLPMYHSAGGILGTSQVIVRGCTACIRTKFSATNFWKDCTRFECTVSQYIEIFQLNFFFTFWLLLGNGLRPQIWRDFVQRFGIAKIGEFYGSTEGNSNLLNIDNRPGACGFIPIYRSLDRFFPLQLLKVDAKSGELLRDERGFCIKCVPGDTGELVGAIRNDPLSRFEGYVDESDTQKKLIRNCQSAGDQVFSTGDVLHWDRLGYLYFKDRCGDTYRWRGENVSTTEVEGVLQPLRAILDATVYGVQVPGREGRAGMIALTMVDGTDEEVIDRSAGAI